MSASVTPGDAWRAYFEGSALLSGELERRMKEQCGLDLGDFNILLVLVEAGGRMRMGALAKQIAFAPGRLTYRMTSLEARGWVAREASTADRRGTDAVLTQAGERTLRRVRPIHARHVQELFLGGLTDAQVEALWSVFGPLELRLRTPVEPTDGLSARDAG